MNPIDHERLHAIAVQRANALRQEAINAWLDRLGALLRSAFHSRTPVSRVEA